MIALFVLFDSLCRGVCVHAWVPVSDFPDIGGDESVDARLT